MEFNLNKLKENPTIVSYDDVISQTEGTLINPEEIDLSEVVVGDLGPDFDPNIIANNEIDTSAFTDEIDNLNETIADISESIDSDSITETVETISSTDDLVESIQSIGENLEESIQQVAEESNQFAEDLMQATEEYLNQEICTPIATWSWDTMSYTQGTSCD